MGEERPLSLREALGLGIPLASGGVLTTAAAGGCVWATARLGGAVVDALEGRQTSWLLAGSVLLVSLLAGWLGTGLARLDPLRRWVAIGVALMGAVALGWGTTGQASVVGPLVASALAFALATPGVGRWFEPGEQVAARGVAVGPFVAAVAGVELVMGALAFVTRDFGRMFAEVGVPTDRPTDLVLALSALVVRHGAWLAPLLLLAAVPLLRLPRRRARPAIGVVVLATVVGVGHAIGLPFVAVLTMPMKEKL